MVSVKICGLTSIEDARAAAAAGADLLGFMFYAQSPRYVAPDQVRAIVRALRSDAAAARRAASSHNDAPSQAARLPRMVGVFVNAPIADVRRILEYCYLDYAQLHGDEPVDDLPALDGRGYKAIRPNNSTRALTEAALYSALVRHYGPHLLVDAYDAAAYGGTGRRGDWELAARVAAQTRHMLLAGGLTPENVADAVRAVRPWGVDVSSGVEDSPGRKDHDAVRRFIANAKSA